MGMSSRFKIVRTPASFIISRSGHKKWLFVFLPITFKILMLQLIYMVLPCGTSHLDNPQRILVFHQLHPVRPEQRREESILLKKDPSTVGWHKKNPKLMRSNNDMTTTPHRTCVGKEKEGDNDMIITPH